MKPKILILTLIMVLAFSSVACAQDLKYAIIQIPTDPTSGEEVRIYFIDKKGERVEGKIEKIERWPIPVKKEHTVRYIDSAVWYISNPTCVSWDGRTV